MTKFTMRHPSRLILPLLLAAASSVSLTADEQQMHASFDQDGVLVSEGELPVLFYQRAMKSLDGNWPRAAYVHPVYDLRGNVITEDFPEDHRHHRGLFWAWHQVWLGEKKLGDPWVCKDFVWDVQSIETNSPSSPLSIQVNVDWKSPLHANASGDMIPVVREHTTITVHAAETSYRLLDFRISLRALSEGVRIGGSDDEKGYGGFSPRIKLSDDQRFVSAAGEVEPTKNAIDAGPWINVADQKGGMVMITHHLNPNPVKPGTPGPWILRRRRSMQNPVYPGRNPVAVSTQTPTVLRYRLVIHDGSLSSDEISSLQRDYWATGKGATGKGVRPQ